MKKLRSLSPFKKDYQPPKYTSARMVAQSHGLDLVLLGTVMFLTLFGLLMVYDSSQLKAFQDYGDQYYFIRQQMVWVVLGIFSLGFFSFFDYHHLQKFATPAFLLSIFLLLLVFLPGLGVSAGGAHRWLRISFLTIQPAEIIKLTSIIFFATFFQKKAQALPFIILTGSIILIIGILQKDLGSAIVFSMIALGIYFVAGSSLVYFLGFLFLSIPTFIVFIASSAYRRNRVLAFLDPFVDPQGFSYHISQVLIALGSGGILGVGIGQSRQKFAYIPEVTTDSIFAIIGEEFGFLGSVVLICLIGFLIIRAFKIAEFAPDSFGKFLAAGLTIWLGVQAVVNLGAMVSLIPLTGVPLPFISYGGSALLANLVAVGILLNISKQTYLK